MADFLPVPPVPDIARVQGETVAEAVEWLVDFYNTQGAPFNYRRGTKIVRGAYKGLHKLHVLTAGCSEERTAVGQASNREVVSLAAPVAFDRVTQVFDLTPRKFSFGVDKRSAYRIPFLFVENGIIKVYFLQPRKGAGLEFDELCMVATIVKQYLLDVEFFGERCDIEFVDVSAPETSAQRLLRKFNLEHMRLWSAKRLADRLTLISDALDQVQRSGRIENRRRPVRQPESDMPLFD